MGTSSERRSNKWWPETLKREIVAASFAPGASVSTIARQYDVNANQVFFWRRLYGPVASQAPSDGKPKLLPVTVVPEAAKTSSPASVAVATEIFEIEVAGSYVVRVGMRFNAGPFRRIPDVQVRR